MSPARRVAVAVTVAATLAACGGGAREPRTVTIRMRHSRFSPDRVTARAGETIRFALRNDDPIAHEFVLGTEAEQRRHEAGRQPTHDGLPGQASLQAGERDEVVWTFERTGALLFGCHRPGHYAYGMVGTVRVVRS